MSAFLRPHTLIGIHVLDTFITAIAVHRYFLAVPHYLCCSKKKNGIRDLPTVGQCGGLESSVTTRSSIEQHKTYIMALTDKERAVICDSLHINHSFTAKCKCRVRHKITVRRVHNRYPVNAISVIYGVFATLCCSTKCQLHIVSSRAMLLLPFTDKECGDINKPHKQSHGVARNT